MYTVYSLAKKYGVEPLRVAELIGPPSNQGRWGYILNDTFAAKVHRFFGK